MAMAKMGKAEISALRHVADRIKSLVTTLESEDVGAERELVRLAQMTAADAPRVLDAMRHLLGVSDAAHAIEAAFAAGFAAGAAVERRYRPTLRQHDEAAGHMSMNPKIAQKRRELRAPHSDQKIREEAERGQKALDTQVTVAARLDMDPRAFRGRCKTLGITWPRGRRPRYPRR